MLIINIEASDDREYRTELSVAELMAIADFLGAYRSMWNNGEPDEVSKRQELAHKFRHLATLRTGLSKL
jgi:hypothetical protein